MAVARRLFLSPLPKVPPAGRPCRRSTPACGQRKARRCHPLCRYLAPLRDAGMRVGLVCAAPPSVFSRPPKSPKNFTQSTSLPSFDWEIGMLSRRRYCPTTAAGRSICRRRSTAPGDGRFAGFGLGGNPPIGAMPSARVLDQLASGWRRHRLHRHPAWRGAARDRALGFR